MNTANSNSLITITTKGFSRFFVASFLLLICACVDQQTSSHLNRDFVRRDSLQKDSLMRDSLRADSLAHIRSRLPDSSFVPYGYEIKDVTFGNLNLDTFPDAIVVLQHDDEEWMDERLRPVLILIGDSTGHFHLAVRNDSLTMSKVEGQMFGEPYNGCEIDSGRFVVRHYGGSRWRWTQDYEFKYDQKKDTWYFTRQFGSWMDMIGDPDTTTYRDTVIVKRKIDLRKFSGANTERMDSPW